MVDIGAYSIIDADIVYFSVDGGSNLLVVSADVSVFCLIIDLADIIVHATVFGADISNSSITVISSGLKIR